MDEQPVQLVRETRTPLPATTKPPVRAAYECEPTGTAALFRSCDHSSCSRAGTAPERKAKTDCAKQVAALLESHYAVFRRSQHSSEA